MATNQFSVEQDKFDQATGKYTCIINFTNAEKSEIDCFIKKHIRSLDYSRIDYVFNPKLGSKVAACKHAVNKNQVKLQVKFIKIAVTVKFVDTFDKPVPCSNRIARSPPQRPPPPPRRSVNTESTDTSNLDYYTLTELQDYLWTKEIELHPEFTKLISHPHYSSFKHAILSCRTEQDKINVYEFYSNEK